MIKTTECRGDGGHFQLTSLKEFQESHDLNLGLNFTTIQSYYVKNRSENYIENVIYVCLVGQTTHQHTTTTNFYYRFHELIINIKQSLDKSPKGHKA